MPPEKLIIVYTSIYFNVFSTFDTIVYKFFNDFFTFGVIAYRKSFNNLKILSHFSENYSFKATYIALKATLQLYMHDYICTYKLYKICVF